MQINKDYICENVNNTGDRGRNGTKADYRWIVVHYTGALDTKNPGNEQTAQNNAIYYKNSNAGASANFFVDRGGVVYMSVDPLGSRYAWHCGVGKSKHKYLIHDTDGTECNNLTALGVEICTCKINPTSRSASDADWYYDPQTYENAVDFIRYLMAEYNIALDHVVRHYDVNTIHKLCPSQFVGEGIKTYYNKTGEQNWADFKQRLQGASPSPVKSWDVHQAYKVVSSDGFLNLRLEPNNSGAIIQQMPAGSYVLATLERSDKWLRVKYCHAGYIWEGYCYKNYLTEAEPLEVREVDSPDGTLNIRTSPRNGGIVATMGNGFIFNVLERAGKYWALIQCGLTIGYCSIAEKYSNKI